MIDKGRKAIPDEPEFKSQEDRQETKNASEPSRKDRIEHSIEVPIEPSSIDLSAEINESFGLPLNKSYQLLRFTLLVKGANCSSFVLFDRLT